MIEKRIDKEDILVVNEINALAFLLGFENLGAEAVGVVLFLELLRLRSGKGGFVVFVVVFVDGDFVGFALASLGGGGG